MKQCSMSFLILFFGAFALFSSPMAFKPVTDTEERLHLVDEYCKAGKHVFVFFTSAG